jgi:3-methyl-2-oxobutanoate hydroxymethyltransferase
MNHLTLIEKLYKEREKIAMLTCYEASLAYVMSEAGLDALLVGDSLGMVVQGHQTTLPVTLEQMAYHTACVARAMTKPLLIVDLPFATYQTGPKEAFQNAAHLMQHGAHMVKLEGGSVMATTIEFLVERGIPVCGHIGLIPQSVFQLGGYRLQGKDSHTASQLLEDAKAIARAGASMIVLEAIPAKLAARITESVNVPTIGIGAGPYCSGQVLVMHDALGISTHTPKFAKNFLAENATILEAIKTYVSAVKAGTFPDSTHYWE